MRPPVKTGMKTGVKTVVVTLLAAGAVALAGGAGAIAAGAFDVAATTPHWPVTTWVMERARTHSIQVRAAGLLPPPGYDEAAAIEMATGHFVEHCSTCHGAPGTARNVVMDGLYPQPPNLVEAARRYTPGEMFWILKNGIKMTGMPSMASDGDALLWNTVALLQRLPDMTDEQFNELWMAAQAKGGMEGMNHGSMVMPMGAVPDPNATDTGTNAKQ